MITLQPISPQDAMLFKAVRLRALQESPQAFGSTYARESALSDSEWTTRAVRWSGEGGTGYIAIDGDQPCGIALSFLDEKDPTRAHLISMWTAPEYRRRGVGQMLVNTIINWAQRRKARVLQLMVVCNNHPAVCFYERLGFFRTGRTEPYPNNPELIEYEMSRPIGQS